MATHTKPCFIGQNTFDASRDQISVNVTGVGDVAVDLSGDVGTRWPADLCVMLKARLDTATGKVWTVSFSYTTGKITFTCNATFYFKLKPADSQRLLTGGDTHPDTGSALAAGETGSHHLGFQVQTDYPAAALSAVSDIPIANCWFPSEPPAEDNGYDLEKVVSCFVTPNGYAYHADYSGVSKGIEKRRVRFEYQDDTSRDLAAYDWWKRYASTGAPVRYVPDREVSSVYTDYVLLEDSCQKFPFDQRLQGYGYYSGVIQMLKVWS